MLITVIEQEHYVCFRLSFVSLDTAEKYNTGKARAVEVEECTCPAGYRGLSCEDCDVGYTRAIEGLYLGICEPCNCNNHTNQCDPETGTCEVIKTILIERQRYVLINKILLFFFSLNLMKKFNRLDLK